MIIDDLKENGSEIMELSEEYEQEEQEEEHAALLNEPK